METRSWSAGLLILLSLTRCAAVDCPSGWTGHNHSCYYLIQNNLDWYEAKVHCDVLGGKLAEIEDSSEDHFLVQFLVTHGGTRAWIGLEDFLVEGLFVWVTTGQQPSYTHWIPGQPDNYQNNEDCGILWPYNSVIQWNDYPCAGFSMWSICEREEGGPIG